MTPLDWLKLLLDCVMYFIAGIQVADWVIEYRGSNQKVNKNG